MTEPVNAFAEAQQNLSDALFRLWLQPLQLTHAALAASSELIAKASDSVSGITAATPDVVAAAEEKIAHLDDEMDQAVPDAAAVVV